MARLVAALALALLAGVALAQYPTRPVRVLIPQPPGGANDTVARVIAPALSERLGQPLVIENRPGANGNQAMEVAAKAPPDGYTLLLAADAQIVINPHFYSNLPFDTLKDLVPVASVVNTQMVLAVNPSLPVKTLPEFIDYARRADPPLAYASIGNGSQHHLVMEMLKQRAGINLLHVPYKGGGEAVTSLLSGTTDSYFSAPIESGQHVKAGKLTLLGASSLKRTPGLADYPTISESGLPGFEVTHYTSLLVKTGTPPEIIAKLSENIVKAVQAPDVREKIAQNGDVPLGTQAEAIELYAKEYERWPKAVKAANVKPG